jgi:hypothetical protein
VDKAGDFAPWVSIVISVASFATALLSFRISRKQAIERGAPLETYIEDVWYNQNTEGLRRYTWKIKLSNPSSNAVSIADAVMHAHWSIGDSGIDTQHAPDVAADAKVQRIDAFGSDIFEYVFSVNMNHIDSGRIRKHKLSLTEGRGRVLDICPEFVVKRE